MEADNGGNNSIHASKHRLHELHERFVDALAQLGGPDSEFPFYSLKMTRRQKRKIDETHVEGHEELDAASLREDEEFTKLEKQCPVNMMSSSPTISPAILNDVVSYHRLLLIRPIMYTYFLRPRFFLKVISNLQPGVDFSVFELKICKGEQCKISLFLCHCSLHIWCCRVNIPDCLRHIQSGRRIKKLRNALQWNT